MGVSTLPHRGAVNICGTALKLVGSYTEKSMKKKFFFSDQSLIINVKKGLKPQTEE